MDDWDRAQRWHDTDHGPHRPPARTSNKFHVLVDEDEPEWVSPCWCCCERCHPLDSDRPNPYYSMTSMGTDLPVANL